MALSLTPLLLLMIVMALMGCDPPPTPPAKEIQDALAGFAKIETELTADIKKYWKKKGVVCPGKGESMNVEDHMRVVARVTISGSWSGSNDEYLRATGPDPPAGRLLVHRLLEGEPVDRLHILHHESAILYALSGVSGIPQVFRLVSDVGVCRARTQVTSSMGNRDLTSVEQWDYAMAYRVVAKALKILRDVHARGIVHGSISLSKFAYTHSGDIADTLGVVDFSRAEFFVEPKSGKHVANKLVKGGQAQKPEPLADLSIWELAGSRKARRDDLFRLAEMALRITGELAPIPSTSGSTNREWIKVKGYPELATAPLSPMIQLYKAISSLDFAATIDYDAWIDYLEMSAEVKPEPNFELHRPWASHEASETTRTRRRSSPPTGAVHSPVIATRDHIARPVIPGARDVGPVARGIRAFNRIMRELQAAADEALNGEAPVGDICPPAGIHVAAWGPASPIDPSALFAVGSSTEVYRSSTKLGDPLVVKILKDPGNMKLRHAFLNEKAFLTVFGDAQSQFVPHLYRIVPDLGGGISDHCMARSMVSGLVGDRDLEDLTKLQTTPSGIATVMAKAIKLVSEIHALGFVHGDIHWNNFVYTERAGAAASLRLIDFGRADPFLDESGNPLPYVTYPELLWSIKLASPWEIDKGKLSPRDDMFRLAEMALALARLNEAFAATADLLHRQMVAANSQQGNDAYIAGIRDLKRNRRFPGNVGADRRIFIDFYTYTLTLGFNDTPDYDGWISRFKRGSSSAAGTARTVAVSPQTVNVASVAAPIHPVVVGTTVSSSSTRFSRVGAHIAEFNRELNRVETAAMSVLRRGAPQHDTCPPDSFNLKSRGTEIHLGALFAKGSDTRLFLANTGRGEPIIVKVLDELDYRHLRHALFVDKAFLAVYGDKKSTFIPRLFEFAENSSPRVSDHCRARSMVSGFVGRYPLSQIQFHLASAAAAALARAIEIVRDVHALGFVHGDIHRDNFVASDPRSPPGSLRLIDFGRAQPFLDEAGRRLPEGTTVFGAWSTVLASPWELRGSTLAPRDDMFRLGEMGLIMAGLNTPFAEAVGRIPEPTDGNPVDWAAYDAAILQLKLQRPVPESAREGVFMAFYNYTMTLRFDDTPNYAEWIHQLQTP